MESATVDFYSYYSHIDGNTGQVNGPEPIRMIETGNNNDQISQSSESHNNEMFDNYEAYETQPYQYQSGGLPPNNLDHHQAG